ncbi:MAG: LacI family DNA-binding transcriptional regulator [Brevinema sp.]
MANIRDVARLAKTSPMTVSRVIQGKSYVAVKTKRKIEQAIKELNYVPNELARNLFKKRTYLLGVLIPDVSHPFFSTLVRHIEIQCYNLGYKVLLCNAIHQTNQEKKYTDILKHHKVDGIILGSHTLDAQEYIDLGIPIVAIDRIIAPNIPVVSSNHEQGGRLVAELLLRNNCKQVLQFSGIQKLQTPSNQRYKIVEQLLKKNNIEIQTIYLEWNNFEFDYLSNKIHETFALFPDTDAIFAVDYVAAICLKILQNIGKKVPQEVQVIGYDGGYVANILDMTTIEQPIENIAKCCVKILKKLIDNKKLENYMIQHNVVLKKGGTTI